MAGRKIEIDGMVCSVGDKPASGYTVAQFIERLQGFPPNAPLGFASTPDSNFEVLAMYEAGETGAVWVDLGGKE